MTMNRFLGKDQSVTKAAIALARDMPEWPREVRCSFNDFFRCGGGGYYLRVPVPVDHASLADFLNLDVNGYSGTRFVDVVPDSRVPDGQVQAEWMTSKPA